MAEDTRLGPLTTHAVWKQAFDLARQVTSNAHDAEDAAAYAFDGVCKEQDKDPGFPASSDALVKFMQTVVSNWFGMKWRKEKVRLRLDGSIAYELETHRSAGWDPEVTEESATEDEATDAEEFAYRLRAIKECVAAMSPERRRLVELRLVFEMNFAAIAALEGLTPGAARTKMYEIVCTIRDTVGVKPVRNRKETR
jgi:DNA-directed RNA polymerase specialized sigma24 family protein